MTSSLSTRLMRVAIVVLATLFGGLSQAANGFNTEDPLVLIPQLGSQAIARHTRILLDTSNTQGAGDVWSRLGEFTTVRQNQIEFAIGDGTYWLYLSIQNPEKRHAQRILEIDYSLTNLAEIYEVEAGEPRLRERISLDKTTFSRNIVYRNPSFQLDIPPQAGRDYLIKLRFSGKANHALESNPILHTTGDFILHQSIVHIFFAAFLGFLFSIAIYNIILSTKVGIKDHIYYSLYLGCYIFIVLFYEGFIFYFPNPPPPAWVVDGMSVVPIYASVSLMAFGRGILQLARFYPRIDRGYKIIIFALLLLSPITVIHSGWLNLVLELSGVAATMTLGVLAAVLHRKGVKAAKYFAISFVFIALGYGLETSLYSISSMSWFNDPGMTVTIGLIEQYFFYICASIEMVFLTLALASYVDQMRQDKERAQADALAQAEEKDRIKSEYTRQLEKDIAERTREVTEKSLMLAQQNQKLREADETKSRFFANISHEFRTPLTLIRGPFQQMMSGNYGELSPRLQEAAIIGSRNSDRLNRLIEELLMLSKLESGNLRLEVAEYEINSFCKRTASLFQHTAQERNIDFTLNIPGEPFALYFDTDKLETVLCNLLSNAFKYTPSGGTVELSLHPSETTEERGVDHFATIKICDNGPGIPREKQAQIFDRFYRMSSANENAIPGSGIGLALVKEIVELHGGSVSVNPELTQGCEFIICLPTGKDHYSTAELGEAKERPITPPVNRYRDTTQSDATIHEPSAIDTERCKLLLVEDNSDMRAFVASLFTPTYQVIEAGNGRMALDILERESVDMVVSDIMMPEMDGLTMLERIREQGKHRHIPVLLLTARAADEDRIMALRVRADDYLAKPFDSEELLLRVRNLIERSHYAASQSVRERADSTRVGETLDSADQAFLNKARQLVLDHLAKPDFNVISLADALFVSKNTLHRRLDEAGASSPAAFMRNIRLERAHQLIQSNSRRTMAEVAYEVGFNSPGYFAKLYKQYLSDG